MIMFAIILVLAFTWIILFSNSLHDHFVLICSWIIILKLTVILVHTTESFHQQFIELQRQTIVQKVHTSELPVHTSTATTIILTFHFLINYYNH